MQFPVLASLLCQIANTGTGGVPALPNGQIFVGNASNQATAVAMSGDATISNAGVVTLANTATARTDIGLGTANTVQFAAMGLGGVSTDPLTVHNGATSQAIQVTGSATQPYIYLNSSAFVNTVLFGVRSANGFFQHGTGSFLNIEQTGGGAGALISGTGEFTADAIPAVVVPNGVYSCGGVSGISKTQTPVNSITVVGGIVTALS